MSAGIDDTAIMIGDARGEWPAFPSWRHVYVQDVDASYRRALEAGGVKDPAGATWWIATQDESS